MTRPYDSLKNAPLLVGIDHQLVGPADLFADNVTAAEVFCRIAAHLELEIGPAFCERFVAETANLLVRVAEPADRCGVGGVALLAEQSESLGLPAAACLLEDGSR